VRKNGAPAQLNGADTGLIGIRITAGTVAGGAIFLEDCLIDGNFSGAARGLSDPEYGSSR
jgi:hypothetical protein